MNYSTVKLPEGVDRTQVIREMFARKKLLGEIDGKVVTSGCRKEDSAAGGWQQQQEVAIDVRIYALFKKN
jgi:hypothetical protein